MFYRRVRSQIAEIDGRIPASMNGRSQKETIKLETKAGKQILEIWEENFRLSFHDQKQ